MTAFRRPTSDLVIACALAALLGVIYLVLRPLVGLPMNDDFSYARSAEAFARTGHIAYNGWGSPLLLPQILYGGLLIRLFGFSYTVLGISGIVTALASTIVAFLLMRRVGWDRVGSTFATAALVFNPIFLPNAPSFMTDVPTLLLLLLALLALAQALGVETDAEDNSPPTLRTAPFVVSVLLALAAGSNRQLVWVAFAGGFALLARTLPQKRERTMALAAAAIQIVAFALAGRWLAAQPYTMPAEPWEGLWSILDRPIGTLIFVSRFWNLAGVLLAGVGVLAWWQMHRTDRQTPAGTRSWLLLVGLALGFFTLFWLVDNGPTTAFGVPQYGNYFTARGPFVGGVAGVLEDDDIWPSGFSALLYLCGSFGLAALFTAHRFRGVPGTAPDTRTLLRRFALTTTVVQFLASIPWYAQQNIFDRYLLLMLPGLLLWLTPVCSPRNAESAPRIALLPASLYSLLVALLGVAFAQTYFAGVRAKAELFDQTRARGIALTELDAGYELNANLQIGLRGFSNHNGMTNVVHPYPKDSQGTNIYYCPAYFPEIHAKYGFAERAGVLRAVIAEPPPLITVSYNTLLPPYRGSVSLYRFRAKPKKE